MTKKKLLMSAMSGAFLAAAAISSPAMALEPRQCLSMEQMNAALRAEGQRVLIIGDRVAVNDAPERRSGVRVSRYVNTVTANADGSLGYQLEGDLPRAQTSTSVCVAAKLTNVRLFDARVSTIPAAAYLGGQFDAVVRENAARGTRPMMIADTVHSTPGGGERRGLPLVMFGNIPSRTGSLATQLSDGNPQFLVLMDDTEYTPAGLARLSQQLALAAP